jgi:RNA polymerase sigma-70 factor (ECF subfamily)
MQEEAELIRAAAAGDRRAFGELVALKRERVVRIAHQITGNLDDALDVAQAVFLKLWGQLGRFDPERRFDTWLYKITVNAAIDLMRSPGSRPALPLAEEAESPAPAVGPEASLDLARLQRAFWQVAQQLAPKQRAVFVLKEVEGMSTAEVARVMGVRESTVRNHLLQARRALRQGLERDFPDLVPRS